MKTLFFLLIFCTIVVICGEGCQKVPENDRGIVYPEHYYKGNNPLQRSSEPTVGNEK